jgi:hypothetical protein
MPGFANVSVWFVLFHGCQVQSLFNLDGIIILHVHRSGNDVSKAQSTFLGTVLSNFTPEAFHLASVSRDHWVDVKSVTNPFLRCPKIQMQAGSSLDRATRERATFEENRACLL